MNAHAGEASFRMNARWFDVDAVRAQFPSLNRRQDGVPVAYFDGPGGTQVPRAVGQAMLDYLYHHNANTHWCFPTSQETDEVIAQAREAMSDLLHATPEEIAFGGNMTSLTFHVARALGRRLSPGDEILVTELDHHANIDPWRALEQERGVTIQHGRMIRETCEVDWVDLESKMSDQTRILAMGAASNAFGTINDLPRAADLAHRYGALLYVDAVHYTPHRLVDVQEWGCDFLACSAYKFYGPHVGILYVNREILEGLDLPKLEPAPNRSPDRLELGTQNHEGIAGATAAVEFLAQLGTGSQRREQIENGMLAVERREMDLFDRLWEGLVSVDGLSLFGPGPQESRTPTAAFRLKNLTAKEVAKALSQQGLFVSHGDFFASTAINRLGIGKEGLVRVGLSCYSTEDEVDRLVRAVDRLAAR